MKVAIAIVGLLALLQAVTAIQSPPDATLDVAEGTWIKQLSRIVDLPTTYNPDVT